MDTNKENQTARQETAGAFPALPPEMTAPLLAWYRACGRNLPWRRTRDPYPIWVSEIMLQQTRVAAVLGYYARFLAAFPTVEALAAAPEEQLMALWQGLGYYSRARNLQRAARIMAERGRFPSTYEDLLALPGVGDYTAGAIASAAFGLPCPAVDGNVLRVAARLTDFHGDILSPAVKTAVRQALSRVLPAEQEDLRIFNQAMMDLGATVCPPNGPPQCDGCPLTPLCLGRERGTAEALPVRGKKKPRRAEERTVLVLLRQGKTALRKRPEEGLLAGLWEFPNLPGALEECAVAQALSDWGLTVLDWRSRAGVKHLFTHVEWRMTGYVLTVAGPGPEDFFWADGDALARHAVPSAFARYRALAAEALAKEAEP